MVIYNYVIVLKIIRKLWDFVLNFKLWNFVYYLVCIVVSKKLLIFVRNISGGCFFLVIMSKKFVLYLLNLDEIWFYVDMYVLLW